MKALPLFRNDDVSYDTEMAYFPAFCDIFHKYGFRQTHAVTLHGLCNYKHTFHGGYCVYPDHPTLSDLGNETIRALSEPYSIADNRELVRYLADSPDDIALHGLYHTNYAAMSGEEQYAEMSRGLEELRALFPGKQIRFFVPPFNKRNDLTYTVAAALGLDVLEDEGVHLEKELKHLNLYPGIWYRYHHHRFYPDSTFDTAELGLERLDKALAEATARPCTGRLPMPSFGYEGDLGTLRESVQRHGAQEWYVSSAIKRRQRAEFAHATGWIYAHAGYERRIFEVGCGSGNNLLWLARHGYEHLGGSDTDPKALAVAEDMAHSEGFTWQLMHGDLLEPAHIPAHTDVVLAINCLYYLPQFSLEPFLAGCATRLTADGCIVLDQIDSSYNGHPLNQWHTSQWTLAPAERDKSSEFRHRIAREDVLTIAARCGLRIIAVLPALQSDARVVYVFCREGVTIPARRPLPWLRQPEEMVEPTVAAIFASGAFDWEWYRTQYVHGRPEIMDPLVHFVRIGASSGFWPNPHFDTDAWRGAHMQLHDPTNPFLHYLRTTKGGASANQG